MSAETCRVSGYKLGQSGRITMKNDIARVFPLRHCLRRLQRIQLMERKSRCRIKSANNSSPAPSCFFRARSVSRVQMFYDTGTIAENCRHSRAHVVRIALARACPLVGEGVESSSYRRCTPSVARPETEKCGPRCVRIRGKIFEFGRIGEE